MTTEGQELDQKSLRYVLEKYGDAAGLACDCVGFANAAGGRILVGIEDGETEPPAGQRVAENLPEQLNKRLTQITTNVGLVVRKTTAANGGEYLEIQVFRNEQSIAATSDGRYFIRVADETRRLLPDDLGRLWNDRNSFVWELQVHRALTLDCIDSQKREIFCRQIRASDRVSAFVKGKSDEELLQHYLLAKEGCLTNLGVLWIGRREDRAALLHAPVIQCIKYDEREQKVRKQMWADYDLNPMELIEAVWREVPDWQESYELPDGLFRKTVPHYDEVVVRELLANALVHRPYTMRGDIFLNLHPDRLEIHNPGLLPIGVTTANILHVFSQRNPHLAKVFYDLKLMEREGSGFDRMYQVLLTSGRPAPEVQEGNDRVVVIVRKKIVRPEIVDFMFKVEREFQPSQKEMIVLGMLAQGEGLTARELTQRLDIANTDGLRPWVSRLLELGLVGTSGKTRGLRYFVAPGLLRGARLDLKTTLSRITPHRLRALILEDLGRYPDSSSSDINRRIGTEISAKTIKRALDRLFDERKVVFSGERRWRRYCLSEQEHKGQSAG